MASRYRAEGVQPRANSPLKLERGYSLPIRAVRSREYLGLDRTGLVGASSYAIVMVVDLTAFQKGRSVHVYAVNTVPAKYRLPAISKVHLPVPASRRSPAFFWRCNKDIYNDRHRYHKRRANNQTEDLPCLSPRSCTVSKKFSQFKYPAPIHQLEVVMTIIQPEN